MEQARIKLPGKVWRILSFIPTLNWISLLYIGVVNSNAMNIICSIAYAIFTFAQPSTSPLLWIVGIVHYSIAYSRVKKQLDTFDDIPMTPLQVPPKYNNTSNAQVFSDITISGGAERKQAIPSRPTPVTDRIQVSFSTDTTQNNFFRDMHKYAAFEGKPAAFVPFMTYWPTYDSMSKEQQAWYFYWRSQVRLDNFLDTDLSYVFLYIYELLSGVGWQTHQEGYELLIRTWLGYKERFPKLNHYLSDWVFDFAQLHGLTYTVPLEGDSVRLMPSAMTDMLVAQHAEDVPLKLPFALIDALCDYSLANSKFYKDGNQDLMQEAIPRVVALADTSLLKKTQKGILATYGPNRPKKQEYYAFRSAVCPQANKKVTLTIKAYSTNQRLRGYINELVRYGENTLRELRGCRGRLRGITLDNETAKLVESFLKKEYGQLAPKLNEPAKKTDVTLDFENIDILREQSDAVRTALQVKEVAVSTEKALLTDIQEVTAVCVALSSTARHLLDRLKDSDWECESMPEDEVLIAEINRLAEHYLGCALLVMEENIVMAEDDYRDELMYIYENPPRLPQTDGNSMLFDLSVLTPELKEFIECLVPEQQKALYALLTCEHPQSELEQIAEESMTMPQILLDDINGVAMQMLGDILVDFMDQEPHILDEYVTSLKQSIVLERSKNAICNN